MRRFVVGVALGSLLVLGAGCGDSKKTVVPEQKQEMISGGPQATQGDAPKGGKKTGSANTPPGAGAAH